MRVLLIEDEDGLRGAIARRLRAVGHAVDEAADRLSAEDLFAEHEYGCVLLDRSLPDGEGLDMLRMWRRQKATTPVLVLTARDAVKARVEGLEAGADDYLVKPFAVEELLARIRAIGRRGPLAQTVVIEVGDLAFDTARAEVRRAGVLLPLRPKELSVLEYLCRRRGRVVSRSQLLDACWDETHEPGSNVDQVAIAALRRKLGAPPLIHTRRGLGYILDA